MNYCDFMDSMTKNNCVREAYDNQFAYVVWDNLIDVTYHPRTDNTGRFELHFYEGGFAFVSDSSKITQLEINAERIFIATGDSSITLYRDDCMEVKKALLQEVVM